MTSLANGTTLTSIFSGIRTAKATLDANYLRPGHYVCRIDKCKIDQNRKKITFAAIEMTVIQVRDNEQGQGHSQGECVTFYVDQGDYFLPEIKSFIGNVMGIPQDQITEEHAAEAFGEGQPLVGTCAEVQARQITTKNGGVFTRVSFRREVPAAEIKQILSPEEEAMYFPDNYLDRVIAAEQAA